MPSSHRIDNAVSPRQYALYNKVYKDVPTQTLRLPSACRDDKEFARFTVHNDRRSKTSFLYIRPPAAHMWTNGTVLQRYELLRKQQRNAKKNWWKQEKSIHADAFLCSNGSDTCPYGFGIFCQCFLEGNNLPCIEGRLNINGRILSVCLLTKILWAFARLASSYSYARPSLRPAARAFSGSSASKSKYFISICFCSVSLAYFVVINGFIVVSY